MNSTSADPSCAVRSQPVTWRDYELRPERMAREGEPGQEVLIGVDLKIAGKAGARYSVQRWEGLRLGANQVVVAAVTMQDPHDPLADQHACRTFTCPDSSQLQD